MELEGGEGLYWEANEGEAVSWAGPEAQGEMGQVLAPGRISL